MESDFMLDYPFYFFFLLLLFFWWFLNIGNRKYSRASFGLFSNNFDSKSIFK